MKWNYFQARIDVWNEGQLHFLTFQTASHLDKFHKKRKEFLLLFISITQKSRKKIKSNDVNPSSMYKSLDIITNRMYLNKWLSKYNMLDLLIIAFTIFHPIFYFEKKLFEISVISENLITQKSYLIYLI